MFNPAGLDVVVQSLSGGTFRLVSYMTTDDRATVLGAGYFTNAASYGLKLETLIVVLGTPGSDTESYLGRITDVDASGNATLVIDADLDTVEAQLQAAIDAEEAARIAADTAEETAREDADTTLQGNIDAEEAARIAADALKADDSAVVHDTGDETVAGVKTFTSIPVGPASDPTTSNQLTRKSYVDTQVATKQPLDSDLTAIAALTTTSFGRGLLTEASASTARSTLGLGTVATLTSDTDGTLAANSDTRVATQKAVKTYVDAYIATQDVELLHEGGIGDDSTDNTAVLAAAITKAGSGGTLRISEGIFRTDQLTMISNLRIVGNGTLKLNSGENSSILSGSGVSNVEIEGITLDGNDANQSVAAPLVSFMSADNATQFNDISLRGTTIQNVLGDGVEIWGCIGAKVQGNTVRDCSGAGISIAADGTAVSESCTVVGNVVDNVGGAGIIAMGNSRNNLVTGNTVRDWNSSDYNAEGESNGDGITGYDIDNIALTIVGNQCFNTGKCTGGHGIHIGGYRSLAAGNTVIDSRASGIYVAGTNSGAATTLDITVTGNTIYQSDATIDSNDYAHIYARQVTGLNITGNTVIGGAVADTAGGGILLQLCAAFAVTGNSIRGVGRNGIAITRISGDSGQTVRGSITGNTIYQPVGHGIHLDYIAQLNVGDNFIYDSDFSGSGSAVNITANASEIDLFNNQSRDGGLTPFTQDSSATGIRWRNNRIINSSTINEIGTVASAATIALDGWFSIYSVTGTTNIATINGGWNGREVTLLFSGTLTVQTSGNILIGYSAAANKALTLVYNSSAAKWYIKGSSG